jgi:ribulose-phosphate 3-epimerase
MTSESSSVIPAKAGIQPLTAQPCCGVAVSLLAADPLDIKSAVAQLEPAKPDFLHVDVMDGHFVPNLSIGPAVVQALKQVTAVPLDVHLMISNPAEQLGWYLEAGADYVTVHIEATGDDTASILATIHAAGAKAGLSLNPGTPLAAIEPYLASLDLVLVMSVQPGFGGQGFIPTSTAKVQELTSTLAQRGLTPIVSVDGGVNASLAPELAAAGANLLVAGNAILKAPSPAEALQAIRAAAAGECPRP